MNIPQRPRTSSVETPKRPSTIVGTGKPPIPAPVGRAPPPPPPSLSGSSTLAPRRPAGAAPTFPRSVSENLSRVRPTSSMVNLRVTAAANSANDTPSPAPGRPPPIPGSGASRRTSSSISVPIAPPPPPPNSSSPLRTSPFPPSAPPPPPQSSLGRSAPIPPPTPPPSLISSQMNGIPPRQPPGPPPVQIFPRRQSPIPAPPPPMSQSLSSQGQSPFGQHQQPDRTPSPQNSGLAPLPSFAVPARLGATNSPAPLASPSQPATANYSQPIANYSLKPTITKSRPPFCCCGGKLMLVNDSRWKFKDEGMLPSPRPYKGIMKDYKSGRKEGSTVPLDLRQFT